MSGPPLVTNYFGLGHPLIAMPRPLMRGPVAEEEAPFTPAPTPFHEHAFLNDEEVLPFTGISSWPASFYDSDQNRTYIAMAAVNQRENSVARVQYFDHGTNLWSTIYDVGAWTAPDDAHGQPVLCKDAEDYLYCFYAGHGTVSGAEARWAISKSPNDITAWNQQTNLGSDLTYPKPVLVGSDMHLFMRKTNTSSTSWLYTHRSGTPSSGTLTFGSEEELIDLGADSRCYAGEVHLRDGTDIHIIMTRADEADTVRKGVYYFIYETDTGDVRNYAGTTTIEAGDLPVDLTEANASFRIFDHGSNRGDIPSLQFDSDGNPHVLFLDGTGTSFAMKHMVGNGSSFSTPETLATVEDANASDGTVQSSILAPGASGQMHAFYVQNADTVRGGDIYLRTRSAGGTWGSAQALLTAGDNALIPRQPVRDAHPSMRMLITEALQSNDYTNAENLDRYAYGDAGFALPPDPIMFQHIEDGDEIMICGEDPNTLLIEDLTWNFLGGITRAGSIGTSGGKMVFNGTTQYVEVIDSGAWTFADDFLIEARNITFTDETVNQAIASQYNGTPGQSGWIFVYQGAAVPPKLAFLFSTDGSATTLYTVEWTATPALEYASIAVQRSGTDLTFWVNGVQVGSAQTVAGGGGNAAAPMRVGTRVSSGSPGAFFGGEMEKLFIVKKALLS